MTIAVYPGSFDPITNGHLDVIGRATGVFDRVDRGVLANPRKQPLLSADERVAVIRTPSPQAGLDPERVDVETFDGLTVDFCRRRCRVHRPRACARSATSRPRSARPQQPAPRRPDVDTVFFMTPIEHSYVSSSLVKEISTFGGDVSEMEARPPALGQRA
jgi:pantetheine-phosphate adenylyltransferase